MGKRGLDDVQGRRIWIWNKRTGGYGKKWVHGEEETAVGFAEHVKNDVGFDAVAPYSGDVYDLLTGELLQAGSRELVEKKTVQGVYRAKTAAFDRLLIAGERLLAVIRKCQGMANKDLGKFADQINSLCDKWDR